jgi:hypothetical protein
MSSGGAAVFRWLRVDWLGDFVGKKVVHGLCLARAGISQADMKSLLAAQAKLDGPLRITLMSRWRQLRLVRRPDGRCVHAVGARIGGNRRFADDARQVGKRDVGQGSGRGAYGHAHRDGGVADRGGQLHEVAGQVR